MLFVSATSGEPEDIVVLFDMSRNESLGYFEQTRNYISGGFLKEFVRKGDTFHLISFGDTPRIELSRRIEGEGDYRTIIGRLLLLYPLAQSSSPENALGYAETFVNELSAGRNKKVILFTAKSGFSAAESGARFNGRTQLYVASIPASFGTLSGGRSMVKPALTVTTPAARPVPPAEKIIPDVAVLLIEPPPENSPPMLNWEYEPIPFDKLKAAMIVLPLALTFLLAVFVSAYILTWKQTAYTEEYTRNTIKDYLFHVKRKVVLKRTATLAKHHSGKGLLHKASEIKEQMV
jgi:hypothetical protein